MGVSVLAATAFDPGAGRVEVTLPEGLRLSEIVAQVLPGLPAGDRARLRAALVSDRGTAVIPAEHWHLVRPRPGVRVVLRILPSGDDGLRSILSIVVSIAAVALGGWLAGAGWLGLAAGTPGFAAASTLIGMGVSIVGSLLINALVPPPQDDDRRRRQTYALSGWRNPLDPDGAVPELFGTMRLAPPFAARSWAEVVGDRIYLRALFVVGEGRCAISDLRIGETPIEDFHDIETEIREGAGGDDPVSLYPRQVVEEQVGVELIRPLPRDDAGNVAGGPAEEEPIVRATGADASGVTIILNWPAGLIRFDDRGRERDHGVWIRIEQRPVDGEIWEEVTVLSVMARKAEGFFRAHSWDFPERGRWQIRLTMLTAETEDRQIQQRTTWALIQTLRPEYPLAYPRPLALIAIRVRATHQLNGTLDSLNALVSRYCLDWDHEAEEWVERLTSNPAAHFRLALQSPSNPKAEPDSALNLALLQDWHDFCRIKGLRYDRYLTEAGSTLREVLTEIAAAGRATPRHDGVRWGVVIDRPSEEALVVDHITPLNSWGFRWQRSYLNPPDAFVVTFPDAENDFREAQRVVPWPGHEGDIGLTEELALPGKVHAAEVWREARRRQLEVIHRPDTLEATQDGILRAVTRGDPVRLSHDVLSDVQRAARVRAVIGPLLELSDFVAMEEGQDYGIRWRVLTDEDPIGTSEVRQVETTPGETALLRLAGTGPAPAEGDLILFGPLGHESALQIVRSIETTEDNCAILRMVDAAPQIDTILDATEIPPWSSRVGAELAPDATEPAAPVWTSVTSGLSGAGAADTVAFLLTPGSGIAIGRYEVDHRPGTSGTWTTVEVPAANGGGEITDYADGATMQLRARAISSSGAEGPYGPVITVVVAATDLPLPAALDDDAISIVTLLGGALVQFGTTADAHTAEVQVYRSTAPTLDRATDAAGEPVAVGPLLSYSAALGDTSREQMLTDAGFDSPGAWTTGAAWTVAGSHATKVASGGAQSISQPQTLVAGKTFRYAITMSGRTAGSLQAVLTGGTSVNGSSYNANGLILGEITADAGGNTAIAWRGTAAFDGTIDTAALYRKTAACLAQGTHYVWLEPRNADGAPGPLAGPFTITIL